MISSALPLDCSIDVLLDRYDAFLLDAYGVLVTSSGPLPGAAAFLDRLDAERRPWLIVTNDASRSIATTVERYRGFGLPVVPERVLTSGALLVEHFAANGLVGARCVVLGTGDSCDYVRDAGGLVVEPEDEDVVVCVVCGVTDEPGRPFVDTMGRTITMVLRQLERGAPMHFVLPNPDLIYPTGRDGQFAFTAGSVAAMLEGVIRLRTPGADAPFVPLGKPYAPMYETGLARLGVSDRRRVVMIGDQLGTDVLGAASLGLDSVLIETGIARRTDLGGGPAMPTWLLSGFA